MYKKNEENMSYLPSQCWLEQKLHNTAWNVTSLTGKEHELVEKAISDGLSMMRISYTKRTKYEILILGNEQQFFYSEVDSSLHDQARVELLTSSRLVERVIEQGSVSSRVALLKLKLKVKILTLVQMYARKAESEYVTFLDDVLRVLDRFHSTD